jgi:hypothetical protein
MKKWRIKNKKRLIPISQEYRSKNKEKLRTYYKKWASENREKLNEYHRKRYQKHKSILSLKENFESIKKPVAKMDFKLFDDCDVNISFDAEISSDAIERLIKHLELYREIYPSRRQIHWLNQH